MKLSPAKFIPALVALGGISLVCLVQALPKLTRDTSRPGLPLRSTHDLSSGKTTGRIQPDDSKVHFLQRLKWITYDWRLKAAHHRSPPVSTNLGFVAMTDDSIRKVIDGSFDFRYGLYWPREVYGRLVRELHRQNAKLIAFDVIFGELRPDHVNTVQLPDGAPLLSDDFFAWTLRQAGDVVLAATPGIQPPALFRTNAFALGDIWTERDADGILRRAKPFVLYREWNPLITNLVTALDLDLADASFSNAPPRLRIPRTRGDEKFYDVPLLPNGAINTEEMTGEPSPAPQWPILTNRVWNMGIIMAARQLELDLSNPLIEPRRIVLRSPNGAERILPLDAAGTLYIDWSLLPDDKRLASCGIENLLANDLAREQNKPQLIEKPDFFKDKLVLVGSTATGNDLTDLGATPLKRETALLSQHWNIANSILLNRFIAPSAYSTELILIIVMGLISAALTWKLRVLWATLALLAVGTAYLALAFYLFIQSRFWVPIVLPLFVSTTVNYVGILAYRVAFEQHEQRHIKAVFSKVVSPDVVNELLNADTLAMGGARRFLTVYFADVRGFTEFTDTTQQTAEDYVRKNNLSPTAGDRYFDLNAAEQLNTVNTYLKVIADTVKRHNGTLDKYIGDCVMAFWGAPVPAPDHALRCVRAAIDAQRAIYTVNQERLAENKRREQENLSRVNSGLPPLPLLPVLTLGSGINTGPMTVGLMGSSDHIFNYTVFGREVNIASRLEGVSGRGRIIISEMTFAELKRHAPDLAAVCLELPPTTVKGIRQAVRIFEVPWKIASPAPDQTPASQPAPVTSPASTTEL